MFITLLGKRSVSLIEDLDTAGIQYERNRQPAVIMNAGELVEIVNAVGGAAPWASLAYVLVNWLKLRQSRKITVTKRDGTIIHLEGFTAAELEQVLPEAKTVLVLEAGEGAKLQD
jgi:hypothetical protein